MGKVDDLQEVQQNEKERIYTGRLNSVLTEHLRGSRSSNSEKITALVCKTSSLKKIQNSKKISVAITRNALFIFFI